MCASTHELSFTDYFDIQANGRWVKITPKGVAGAHGAVTLHPKHLPEFFKCLREFKVEEYGRWCSDPVPVGGRCVLLRKDGAADKPGMLLVDPDTHPSRGQLVFGDPAQEQKQIAALIAAESFITQTFATIQPTEAEKTQARERASLIKSKARFSFMPPSGYCPSCESDVTSNFSNVSQLYTITGCPVCGASWCD